MFFCKKKIRIDETVISVGIVLIFCILFLAAKALEVPETAGAEGVAGMLINDIVLIGITRVKGKHQAVINGPQGFPFTINVGTKFADGFVLSIHESKVVFRKTRERGVPLYKPKDVVKEINPEER